MLVNCALAFLGASPELIHWEGGRSEGVGGPDVSSKEKSFGLSDKNEAA